MDEVTDKRRKLGIYIFLFLKLKMKYTFDHVMNEEYY